MEGGGWRVEGGGWRVEGGGWRVEGGGGREADIPDSHFAASELLARKLALRGVRLQCANTNTAFLFSFREFRMWGCGTIFWLVC